MTSLTEKVELKPGAKVDMRYMQSVSRDGRGNDEDHFVSGIYDIEEDGTLELEMPTRAGKAVLVPMGVRYEMIFTMDQRLFKSEAQITQRFRKDGFSLIKAKLIAPVVKFQRREYYRLNVMLPITFITLDERAGTLERMAEIRQLLEERREELLIGEGTILNISGGGIRFISDTEIGDAKYLFMRFAIEAGEENRTIALIGELVAKELTEDKKHNAYRMRILFKDSRCQEMIIRYIFDQERKIRRKELGG
ncbi:MAG: flagellar brake domain-containing protein [Lachnospiraceae bacterium]|nr:flagellar brake domain-containing protein [Lachnospiraceae bacterium]